MSTKNVDLELTIEGQSVDSFKKDNDNQTVILLVQVFFHIQINQHLKLYFLMVIFIIFCGMYLKH